MLLPLQIVVVVIVGTYSKCVPKRLKGPTIPTNSNKANNNDDKPPTPTPQKYIRLFPHGFGSGIGSSQME